MWKTRPSRCIQRMGAGDSRTDWGPGLGMMRWRCLRFGANSPWYRVRWARGRGTERARYASGTSAERARAASGTSRAARRAMPNRQDCRFAQPEAAPKGCGTRMCRMNSMGSSTTLSRPVTDSVLESIHDLPAVIDRETFVRQHGAGDVAAQAFEGVPFMGFAHGAGMEGEPRELGDAGVAGRRAGVDGAKRQGLAPGVGAGGDAVVHGGAEELLEIAGGLDVEGGVCSSRSNSPCFSRARVTRVAMAWSRRWSSAWVGAATRWNRGASSSNG